MQIFFKLLVALTIIISSNLLANSSLANEGSRLSMFIGVDVSGSFMKSKYYNDAMDFLAHYIYYHVNGIGGIEQPKVLFMGTLGGVSKAEARTLFPIQTFQNKSVAEIRKKINEILPHVENPYTDFNAFFEQVESTVKNKNLVLRPISVVLISDGHPDFPDDKKKKRKSVRDLSVDILEQLSRNVTIRVLYTDPVIGDAWHDEVKRQRVKIWTQDAPVMVQWKDPKIFEPNKNIDKKEKLFKWILDNVDFPVRGKRVD